jgi:hypothetical protein
MCLSKSLLFHRWTILSLRGEILVEHFLIPSQDRASAKPNLSGWPGVLRARFFAFESSHLLLQNISEDDAGESPVN